MAASVAVNVRVAPPSLSAATAVDAGIGPIASAPIFMPWPMPWPVP